MVLLGVRVGAFGVWGASGAFGVRLGCVWGASVVLLGCVCRASGVRLGCAGVREASGVRLGCAWGAPGVRLGRVCGASGVRLGSGRMKLLVVSVPWLCLGRGSTFFL